MKKAIFILLILLASCGRNSNEETAFSQIDSLENEIRELKIANDTLSEQALRKSFVTKNYPAYFDTIANPEEFLLNHLQKKPELIPKKAVLGGTMRFTGITFINEELFVAEYEDGHIMGKTVYKYSRDKKGNLRFYKVGTVE
ncbi:MAG TPA: hypothetical protein VK941_14495 [Gillisia sp.]|nr:hypothetical protein [Gillisia sp.]